MHDDSPSRPSEAQESALPDRRHASALCIDDGRPNPTHLVTGRVYFVGTVEDYMTELVRRWSWLPTKQLYLNADPLEYIEPFLALPH